MVHLLFFIVSLLAWKELFPQKTNGKKNSFLNEALGNKNQKIYNVKGSVDRFAASPRPKDAFSGF